MTILLVLIPISLLFLLLAIGFLVWAIRSEQFENLDSAAIDILAMTTERDRPQKVAEEPVDAG